MTVRVGLRSGDIKYENAVYLWEKDTDIVLAVRPDTYKTVEGSIVSFTDDERILQPACTELAYALQHQSKGSVSFAEMNGESLKERNEYRRLLHAAGFVDSPQGMKLYV